MSISVWSQEELAIFDLYYLRVKMERLFVLLPNKSRCGIDTLAKKKGWFPNIKKKTLKSSELVILKKKWPVNGLALGDLKRELNVTAGVLRKHARYLGLHVSDIRKNVTKKERHFVKRAVSSGRPWSEIFDTLYYRPRTLVHEMILQYQEGTDNVSLR